MKHVRRDLSFDGTCLVQQITHCFCCVLFQILLDVKTLFMSQPSLMEITIPAEEKFTVCGDIHGQFYDLMNIFDLNGLPSTTNPYVSFAALAIVA